MNGKIRIEIERSLDKLNNLRIATNEIQGKIDTLEKQLEGINRSIEKERVRIQTLGRKTPSRDENKPDTEERIQQKARSNSNLDRAKAEFLQEPQTRETYIHAEKDIEELLRGFTGLSTE